MNRRVSHLAKRWWSSLSRRAPGARDLDWTSGQLLPGEFDLWSRMRAPDRRHSILVARRFADLRPTAIRDEVAAALLHDVGKIDSDLGTGERVLATVLGPRTDRWRRYHDHERIGAQLGRDAGSTTTTLEILTDPDHPVARIIRMADDI